MRILPFRPLYKCPPGEEEAGTKRKRKKKLVKVEPKQRENVETKLKGKLETKPKGKKFSLKFGPLDVSAPLARYKAMATGVFLGVFSFDLSRLLYCQIEV